MNCKHFSHAIVIATAAREQPLRNALVALKQQTRLPDRIIIADGAPAPGAEKLTSEEGVKYPMLPLQYHRCNVTGAGAQRNEAAQLVTEDVILFMDDDLYPEKDCLEKMLSVLEHDTAGVIGAVGIQLTNQYSRPPSRLFKRWLDFMADEKQENYAGKVIGPALNLLPEFDPADRVIPIEWLNSGCTAYRREAFLAEMFAEHFYGYSFMEDVDLSLRVGRKWQLVVRTGARAYHDSQESQFKLPYIRSKMEIENRYYVMTRTLGRKGVIHHIKFLLSSLMGVIFRLRACIAGRRWSEFFAGSLGMLAGLRAIVPLVTANLAANRKQKTKRQLRSAGKGIQ